MRYGKCSIIKTLEYEFLFNLNGEVKFIRGLNLKNWPHSTEQLKRTDGNDWMYYSVRDAFQRMLEINTSNENIEITANFLLGEQLPAAHYHSLAGLLGNAPSTSNKKGTVYLS